MKPLNVEAITLEELKAFIQWAKDLGLKRAKIGEIEFELSDIALIPLVESQTAPTTLQKELSDKDTRTFSDDLTEEDEDLLYHSAR